MDNQELLIKHLKLLQGSCENLYSELAHSNSMLLAQADNILTEAEILELIVNGRYADISTDYKFRPQSTDYDQEIERMYHPENFEPFIENESEN